MSPCPSRKLRTRKSNSRNAKSRRRQHNRSTSQPRFVFEALEDRRLLATFTVTNLADGVVTMAGDQPGTLRQAIFDANAAGGSDMIDFSVTGILNLTSGELAITDDLTILGDNRITLNAGDGANGMFGDGDGFRIFNIDDSNASNIDVTLSGLTLKGGDVGGTGGAIRNTENLTLEQSTITGNAATGRGGGVYNSADGDLTVDLSRFLANTTTNDGGGLFNLGVANVMRSSFTGNSATDGGGLVARGVEDAGSTTVNSSTFSANTASDDGGAIANNQGRLRVFSSTISGNTATNDGGGIYSGGNSDTTIRYSTISDNGATTGGGIRNNGAAVAISSTIVSGSTSGRDLEGGFNGGNNLVEDGFFNGASAISGDPMLGPLADNGGPTQTHALLSGSPAIDQGSSFATNDQRGAPFARRAGPFVDIGAYEQQTLSLVVDTISDVSDGNFTPGNLSLREAIGLAGANPGADTITFSSLFDSEQTIHLSSQLPTITDDLTITGPGLDLLTLDAGDGADNTFATGDGYRLLEIDDGTDTEIVVALSGLTLTGGDAPAFPFVPEEGGIDNGGAILSEENLTLADVLIDRNAAAGAGGVFSRGSLMVENSAVSNNRSRNGGGGGISSIGDLTITNSTISGNRTNISGGGVATTGGTFNLLGSTVSGNAGFSTGGGVLIRDSATAVITESTIVENQSSTGAGIDSVFTDSVTLTNSIVANNASRTNYAREIRGTVSGSFNLIGDAATAGGLTDGVDNNIVGNAGVGVIDPLLGPLALNGGPTKTHALLPGSPAIDAGNSTETFDQRGLARVVDQAGEPNAIDSNGSDIGAFERQAIEPIGTPPTVTTTVRDEGGILERPDLLSTFAVTFDVEVNVSTDDLIISNDTLFGTAVDTSALTLDYNSDTNTATWDFASLTLDPAYYSFELSSDIVSAANGLSLDDDNDGNPGGAFIESVYVALPGDANLDGQVNVLGDAFALVGNLGTTGGATWADGDFNNDGNVNVLGDAFILVGNLGQSVLPPVPSTSVTVNPKSSKAKALFEFSQTTFAFAISPISSFHYQEDDRDVLPIHTPSSPLELAGHENLDTAFESNRFLDDHWL